MQGVLLVDKPLEWTSFDVVNYIRKIIARSENKKPLSLKVGHIGTLDPLASGLLVILIGAVYTKQASLLSKLDKTYQVTMRLGQYSNTDDQEGEFTNVSNIKPSKEEIEAVLQQFSGPILQRPPAYSAIKINGKRAYKFAREGQPLVLEARPVMVYANTLNSYNYPYVKFCSKVSTGTYIRSLARDMGQSLETGAYMSALRRTIIGEFQLKNALSLDGLNYRKIEESLLNSTTL